MFSFFWLETQLSLERTATPVFLSFRDHSTHTRGPQRRDLGTSPFPFAYKLIFIFSCKILSFFKVCVVLLGVQPV